MLDIITKRVRAVFLELDALKRVGIVADRNKEIQTLQKLVDFQGEVLSALNAEYGKNLYRLHQLKGEF